MESLTSVPALLRSLSTTCGQADADGLWAKPHGFQTPTSGCLEHRATTRAEMFRHLGNQHPSLFLVDHDRPPSVMGGRIEKVLTLVVPHRQP